MTGNWKNPNEKYVRETTDFGDYCRPQRIVIIQSLNRGTPSPEISWSASAPTFQMAMGDLRPRMIIQCMNSTATGSLQLWKTTLYSVAPIGNIPSSASAADGGIKL
jgi:hypothetical protein